MPSRPVVGITSYAVRARWGEVWDDDAALLPRAYVDHLAAAGAAVVLLPAAEGVEHTVAALDALVLAGGGDIDPGRYGAAPGPRTDGVDPARDAAELALLAAARGRGLPVLGICRGMQVINIAHGGTLHQHLPDVVGTDTHRRRPGLFDPHPVRVAADSRLAGALGRVELDVPAYHHQAVDRVGAGLRATAWTADGTVEALEPEEDAQVLAVQWHPEMGEDPALFRWLLDRARAAASPGAGGEPRGPR